MVGREARTVAVVGLGLVGGSVARRLVDQGLDVVGVDPSAATRTAAAAVGVRCAGSIGDLAVECGWSAGEVPDVVVVAVPLRAMAETARELASALGVGATRGGVVLTDVGSVKAPVREAFAAAGLAGSYVGAHPMAGTEQSGFAASSAQMLAGARWAVTVDPATDAQRLQTLLRLVTGPLGGSAVLLSDADHDRATALVSHVPHVLATELLRLVGRSPVRDVALGLAAGSFRDGTRVGRTDPRRTEAMVRDNANDVAPLLREVARDLAVLAGRLERGEDIAAVFDEPAPVRETLARGGDGGGDDVDAAGAAGAVGSAGHGDDWRARLLAEAAAGAVVVGVDADTGALRYA
ncbi:prephenate dehydrogenase [Paraoerskovia sediminicola]|uniref:Prephenate dehydrogenase n=1 Tax=Paraoerskovia sediminicola TaxID=1138587 RepID=A0ABM8FYT0_9CELL|nr:prephenate dehydrogenase [Paraoerskovia sediminicola]